MNRHVGILSSCALALAVLLSSGCGSDAASFGAFLDAAVLDGSGGSSPDGGVTPDPDADLDAGADGTTPDTIEPQDVGTECVENGDCGGGEICRDGRCREVECIESADCPGGFRCDDFLCVSIEQVCEPGSRRCEGDTVLACNDAGTSELAIACADLPACAESPFGCACALGECTERVCRPGATRCDGQDVLTCAPDGQREVRTATCTDGETCQGGECLDASCTPGETRCAGETLLTCDFAGTWSFEDCALLNAYCESSVTPSCEPWLCEPGSRTCTANLASVLVCDERGASTRRTDCGDGEYCRSGACLPQVCEPLASFCSEGDAYVCDASGGNATLLERCSDAEVCLEGRCTAAGGCTSNSDCPVPAASCAADTLVQYSASFGRCTGGACSFDAVTTRTNCERFEQVCSPGPPARCIEPGCARDADCDGGVCVAGACEDCRNNSDCGANQWCDRNDCVACTCPPGQTCGPDGECIGGGACRSDSECQSRAAALGYTGEDAACDARGECFVRGVCGGDASNPTAFDPFGAACPAGTTCQPVLDLFGGTAAFNACQTCEVDGDCREGEVCVLGLLGLLPNYCGTEGGGFPFPFP